MMERLTQKFDSGAWGIRGSIDDAVLRLAAYEDSGLSPVEIYRLKREKDRAAARMSREQVEKVWRGEWIIGEPDVLGVPIHCSRCGWGSDQADQRAWMEYKGHIFCGHCGAPMTEKAVQMVMERLEAMLSKDEYRSYVFK